LPRLPHAVFADFVVLSVVPAVNCRRRHYSIPGD
jgi:hypothetical protein